MADINLYGKNECDSTRVSADACVISFTTNRSNELLKLTFMRKGQEEVIYLNSTGAGVVTLASQLVPFIGEIFIVTGVSDTTGDPVYFANDNTYFRSMQLLLIKQTVTLP